MTSSEKDLLKEVGKIVNGRMVLFSLGIIGSLILISGCIPSVQASETRSENFSITGKPTLVVSGNDIDVQIKTQADLQQVQISALVRAWGTSQSDAEQNLRNRSLTMNQFGDEIQIRESDLVSFHFGFHVSNRIELEILMPTEADMRISVDDGDVDIRDISGLFDIHTDDGEIDLVNVNGTFELEADDGNINIINGTGSLYAHTDDGDISFSGRLIGPEHTIRCDDGDVSLKLPSDLALHIDVSMDNGSLRTSLPFRGEVHSENHWSGTLNGSESVLLISTDDGNITIGELPN